MRSYSTSYKISTLDGDPGDKTKGIINLTHWWICIGVFYITFSRGATDPTTATFHKLKNPS